MDNILEKVGQRIMIQENDKESLYKKRHLIVNGDAYPSIYPQIVIAHPYKMAYLCSDEK